MDRTEWVLLGVGLNVNNTLSQNLSRQAQSLYRLTGRYWPRAEILKAFLKGFHTAYGLYLKEGFEPFRLRYWSHYFAPNRVTVLKTATGRVSGIARGVDASGAIMLESRRKIHMISEGEIIS
jgi:BirA family biotin operon repressor/biotin-[acetyl-CoA-carboxylase] ligase